MIECSSEFDTIFDALADPTRRDILARLRLGPLNVSEIACGYDVSLAAVSKHLQILEGAQLVDKRKQGKERIVTLVPQTITRAVSYLQAI